MKKYILLVITIFCLACNTKQSKEKLNDSIPIATDYLSVDTLITKNNVVNHVRIFQKDKNNGSYITILPSLGRGVEDYTEAYQSTITTKWWNKATAYY